MQNIGETAAKNANRRRSMQPTVSVFERLHFSAINMEEICNKGDICWGDEMDTVTDTALHTGVPTACSWFIGKISDKNKNIF